MFSTPPPTAVQCAWATGPPAPGRCLVILTPQCSPVRKAMRKGVQSLPTATQQLHPSELQDSWSRTAGRRCWAGRGSGDTLPGSTWPSHTQPVQRLGSLHPVMSH